MRPQNRVRFLALVTSAMVSLTAVAGVTQAMADTRRPSPQDQVVIEITDSNYRDVANMSNSRPVIWDIGTSWCGYCKSLWPKMVKAVQAQNGKVILAHVDAEESRQTMSYLGSVRGYPTLKPWKNGRLMSTPGEWAGDMQNQAATDRWVQSVISAYGPLGPTVEPSTFIPPVPSSTYAPPPSSKQPPSSVYTPPPPPSSKQPPSTTRPPKSSIRPPKSTPPVTPSETPDEPTITPTPTRSKSPSVTPTPSQTPTETPLPPDEEGKLPPLPPGAKEINTVDDWQTYVFEESMKRVVIVDLSKDGCGGCIDLAPVIDKKYRDDKGKWQYVRFDGTKIMDLWKQLGQPWFPSLIAFKDGKEIGRRTGFEKGEDKRLYQWIDQAASGKVETEPTYMDIKTEDDFMKALDISQRHPVILRIGLDSMPSNKEQGETVKAMAAGDGSKWTAAFVDPEGPAYRVVRDFLGSNAYGMPAVHVIVFQGAPRYEDELTVLHQFAPDKAQLREWINTALMHHYAPVKDLPPVPRRTH